MITELFSKNAFLWPCLWQSTTCIAAGLVGSFVLRRRAARAHQVLLLAMIAAVAVPVMSTLVKYYELGMFVAKPVITPLHNTNEVVTTRPEMSGMITSEDNGHKSSLVSQNLPPATFDGITWRTAIYWGWLAASLILTGRLVITFAMGIRLLRRAMPLDCKEIAEAVHTATAKLGLAKDLRIYSSRSVHSPVIWCWSKRPILLVPTNVGKSANKIDWVSVLCHELAHYKRRDHISGLLSELMVCVLPWNPLLWWAKSRLIRLSEQACDDWVVALGRSGTDYAESLLDLAPGGQMAFVPAVVVSKKGLAARVARILKDKCSNPTVGLRWAIMAVITAGLLAIGVAFAQTRPAKAEPAIQPKEKPTITLHEAAAAGDIEQVKLLISKGADVNAKDRWGSTALHLAAHKGHTEIARFLVDNGADVNVKEKADYWTPLYWAVFKRHKNIVELLIAKGANVNAKDRDGWTPLHRAAKQGDEQIVELLLSKGADINAKNKLGQPPLHLAIFGGHRDVTELLLTSGADMNSEAHGKTPVALAMNLNQKEILELLVAKGANVSFIHLAAYLGDEEKVKILIEEGASVNAKNKVGDTLLHCAAYAGHEDVAAILISKGANVNAGNKSGEMPLHAAASNGHVRVAELLIAKGADVNAMSNGDWTPVYLAAYGGHKDTVKLLIDNGADVNAKNKWGWTPLLIAASKGYKDVVELLIAGGANINAKRVAGWTSLHYAALNGHKEVVQTLLTKGADVNVKIKNGGTPLSLAHGKGHTEIVELLRKHGARE